MRRIFINAMISWYEMMKDRTEIKIVNSTTSYAARQRMADSFTWWLLFFIARIRMKWGTHTENNPFLWRANTELVVWRVISSKDNLKGKTYHYRQPAMCRDLWLILSVQSIFLPHRLIELNSYNLLSIKLSRATNQFLSYDVRWWIFNGIILEI